MKTSFLICSAVMLVALAVPPLARTAETDEGQRLIQAADVRPDVPPAPPGSLRGHTHGAYSRPAGSQGQGPAYGRWGGAASMLNLSPDQRAKMRDLWMRSYLDTRDLRYDLMQRRLEMRRLFTDPKADSAALTAKQKEVSALQQRLMDRRAQTMIEWRALLTPEQIQKLDLAGMAHSRMGSGMQPGMMGHGMGPGMQPGMMGGHMW